MWVRALAPLSTGCLEHVTLPLCVSTSTFIKWDESSSLGSLTHRAAVRVQWDKVFQQPHQAEILLCARCACLEKTERDYIDACPWGVHNVLVPIHSGSTHERALCPGERRETFSKAVQSRWCLSCLFPGRGISMSKSMEKQNATVCMGKEVASGIKTLNVRSGRRLNRHCWQERCLPLNREHSPKLSKGSSSKNFQN